MCVCVYVGVGVGAGVGVGVGGYIPGLNHLLSRRCNSHGLINNHFGSKLPAQNSALHGTQEFLRRPITCKGEVRDGCPLLWPVCVCVVCVCVCVRVCSPLALAIQTYSNKKGEN